MEQIPNTVDGFLCTVKHDSLSPSLFILALSQKEMIILSRMAIPSFIFIIRKGDTEALKRSTFDGSHPHTLTVRLLRHTLCILLDITQPSSNATIFAG